METPKKSRNAAIISVPKEIIEEEILPRLPVKSLMRFRCVSKSWRSLIGSKQFIKTQLENSTKNTSSAHHRVIFPSYSNYRIRMKQYSLHTLLNEPSIDPSSPTDDPRKIVGCCNGLLCVRNGPTRCFSLWNPATKISFKLPEIEPEIQPCGFGYDASSRAYKVFAVLSDGKEVTGTVVYSSKTNSWRRTLGSFKDYRPLENKSSKFVCGKIHWLSRIGISSFDLKSGVLGVINYPCDLSMDSELDSESKNKWLGEIKGCLCLVSEYIDDEYSDESELGVWVMKKSWVKVLNVPFDFLDGCCSLHHSDHRTFLALFEIVLEGVVLVICGSDFVALNRDDAVLCSPKKLTGSLEMWAKWKDIFRRQYWDTHFYVESLVSPVPEANHSRV